MNKFFYRIFWMLCFFITLAAYASVNERDPFFPATVVTRAAVHSLRSNWITVYFAKADDVVSFITQNNNHILSPYGKIKADIVNNQIWIQDDAKHLFRVRAFIKHLDQPSHQFLITAKIINIDREYQRKLGLLFEGAHTTFTVSKFFANTELNIQLSALEEKGHAQLISNPALITLNNKPAVIESGAQIPYQEATSSGATSVSFKKAVLRLQVTPQRMPNHHILLHIVLNQDKVSPLTVQGVPAIQTQKIETEVIVKNQETIVLGGILETTRASDQRSVPILGQLPAVGGLFKHHTRDTKQRELLIFITPTMMNSLT